MNENSKAELEQIIVNQQKILKAMQKILSMLEFQNEQIENLSKK